MQSSIKCYLGLAAWQSSSLFHVHCSCKIRESCKSVCISLALRNVVVQGRHGRGGGRGPWPTLEFRSSDFSEILRFCRKITDFGLAQSTFSLDLFCIAFSSSNNICPFRCYFIDIFQILVLFLAAFIFCVPVPQKNYEDLVR